ncbi:MAG: hypothetical protein FWG21_02635 [Oscillospiraceae bacterium]|nr:hypothetical protein [Oscillospiraceae bacterium]
MELKKNKLLQICGILMIIGGSLQIILSLIVILGLIVLLAIAESGTFLLFISALLIIVSAVVSFIAGIVGTKNAANPAKADKCIFYGFFCIALSLLGNIIGIIGGNFNTMSLFTGLVIPGLYLLGAYQNKKLQG